MISKCNIFKGNSEMWALFKVPISLKCGHPEIAHNKFFISINHKDWIINGWISLIPQDTNTIENTVERKTRGTSS